MKLVLGDTSTFDHNHIYSKKLSMKRYDWSVSSDISNMRIINRRRSSLRSFTKNEK